MSITYISGNALINTIFAQTGPTIPATLYLGLLSAATISGTYSEISGTSYSRVAIPSNTTNWNTSTVASTTNKLVAAFPESGSAWSPTATYLGFFDASSAGNLWFYDLLTPSLTIAINTTVQFSNSPSGITISMTNS